MAEYSDELRGVLFNELNKKTPSHPDMKGTCQICNEEYYISGWKKVSKAGKEYISISFCPKNKDHIAQSKDTKAQRQDRKEDELPF